MPKKPTISIPKSLSNFAKICLETLKSSHLGQFITRGGAVGWSLYHEFRTTKDVDAWWKPDASENDRQSVINLIKTTLENFGTVRIRRFGDVVSLDLRQQNKVILLHLNRVEKSRPLETIVDLNQRNHANQVRVWFKNEFCKGKYYSH